MLQCSNAVRAVLRSVPLQVLAELEEAVDYKQTVMRVNIDLEALKNAAGDSNSFFGPNAHQYGSPSSKYGGTGPAPAVDLVAKKQTLIRKWKGRLKWVPKEVDAYRQILVRGSGLG